MGKPQTPSERAEKTLLAMKEFKWFLEGMEKELSVISKKFSDREIAQSVGFVAAGIHEALSYMAIVRKVIEKTERRVAKRNTVSESSALSTNPLE